MTENKPHLLLPAGDPECFEAALSAGADEIYIGGKNFNARIGAQNFTDEEAAAYFAETGGRLFASLSVFSAADA